MKIDMQNKPLAEASICYGKYTVDHVFAPLWRQNALQSLQKVMFRIFCSAGVRIGMNAMKALKRSAGTMPASAAGFLVHLAMFAVMLPVAIVVIAIMAVAHVFSLVQVQEASE